ncbi:16S rRNA (cytidine(1402)-2'-O)-methyltransferase [Marinobacter oulmenensis]|uniref:Ribosomal RNA small subunit methyltransferase I n=1 Tax=Marinobacter oulmenensis TaxID=643747 RepID=A0A840UC97_9GAMM|nr:16S rRNA (cytidine(1402)-2'-O)-methyltransferase [Marinobacter oulmenensis]MBB5322652.1 16S rRNA (cytidine1402-2'-O)-methyltransferase [Marinobacter oulmenensis]
MSEQQLSGSSGGVLYIVATPIGNLGDLSERAGQVLTRADRVAAEDTRHTGKLLQHLGISKPMIALHDHNERDRFVRVIDALLAGEDVALVSDAGTPLISDPGYVLVREARAAGLRVCPVPGACALVAGLSAAGLPTDRFLFAGFLPAKRSGRKAALEEFRDLTATLVLYESPHRILDLLADLVDVFGRERECVLGRELTKTFETFYSGSVASVLEDLKADPNGARGEFVVMVHGADPVDREGAATLDSDRLLSLLIRELPVKKAARIVAEVSGLGKNELYQRALAIKDAGGN